MEANGEDQKQDRIHTPELETHMDGLNPCPVGSALGDEHRSHSLCHEAKTRSTGGGELKEVPRKGEAMVDSATFHANKVRQQICNNVLNYAVLLLTFCLPSSARVSLVAESFPQSSLPGMVKSFSSVSSL